MSPSVSLLDELGPRICILGPSNAGKSTLADAIARTYNTTAVHLDLLRHLPNTDWTMRSDEDFVSLHNEAIKESAWIMDGNYLSCSPQRLERATGLILLEVHPIKCLWRYFRRTILEKKHRVGALEGNTDTVKWEMISWIVFQSHRTRTKLAKKYGECTIPKVKLSSKQAIDAFYEKNQLERRGKTADTNR